MNGAVKEIQETAPLIEDGSLIFLLCQLIVDVLKLNGLGVITVSDTADADIFGTIPVAEALLSKGAQLGTVLSFMMAVTTLSLPSLIMLRKAVKPKLLALFIGVCAIGIIIVGYLFNVFQFILM